jgi:hypothetical protein
VSAKVRIGELWIALLSVACASFKQAPETGGHDAESFIGGQVCADCHTAETHAGMICACVPLRLVFLLFAFSKRRSWTASH